MRLLFLEDDRETARSVSQAFAERGFDVEHVADVAAAVAALDASPVDAAVLDLMVPGGSGYDVLEEIRSRDRHVPVLILTALDAVEQRVNGLERGADDYLVKPFAFSELVARMRALLRRPPRRVEPLRIGDLEIDPLHHRATCRGARVDLTRTELALLQALAERRGEVLNRQLLLELVWGYRFDPGTNIVDVHVNRLRRKLGEAGHGELIRTVRGVGYAVD